MAEDDDQPDRWKTLWIPLIVVGVVVVGVGIAIGVMARKKWRQGVDPNDVLLAPLPPSCRFPNREVQSSLSKRVLGMCGRELDCNTTMTPKHAQRLDSGAPTTVPGVQREIDSTTFLAKLLENRGLDVAKSGELRRLLTQYVDCSLDMVPLIRRRCGQVKDGHGVRSVLQQLHNLLLVGKTTLLEGEYYKSAAILSRANGQLAYLTRVLALHDSPHLHRAFGSLL